MEEKEEMRKRIYIEPKVLATYDKEELKDMIMPHGSVGGGCGPS